MGTSISASVSMASDDEQAVAAESLLERAGRSNAKRTTFTWEDLLLLEGPSFGTAVMAMGRTKEVSDAYASYKTDVLAVYASPTDAILHRRLGMEVQAGPEGKLVATVSDKGFLLRANDFPYAIEDGIDHFVLWRTSAGGPITAAEARAELKSNSSHYGLEGSDIICFVNPPKLMSVPRVQHAHVFARKVREKQEEQKL